MNTHRVQVHIPYPLLTRKLSFVLDERINPEIYMDAPLFDSVAPDELKEIGSEFRKRSLTITMHGPYVDLNPGSADEEARLFTAETYEKAFAAAEYLGPRTIVLHAGYNERRFKGDKKLWLSQSMKTWPRFVAEAQRLGLVIAAENIFEKTPDTLKTLAETISSPHFGLCLDSGHLNVFAKGSMDEWVATLGAHLAEVHLHDNNGDADEHLPIGDGSIDFALLFSLLRQYAKDPVYTIEPHGEEMLRRGIEAVEKYL